MKVLIVDDEPLIRLSLKRVFEARNHSTQEAENGEEGLHKWREGDPDVVILDVLMPGRTGFQVLSEIGASRRAKVILISAYTGESEIGHKNAAPADLFIAKPFQNIFEIVDRAENLVKMG